MIAWLANLFNHCWIGIRQYRRRSYIDRLCARGMRIGRNVQIMQGVHFDVDYPWLIELGDGCRISTNVRFMAHDATAFRDLGVTRIGQIRILQDSVIGENSILLPGVSIGPRALIAAGSVVSRDIGADMLAAGNPARVYGKYEDFIARTVDEARKGHIASVRNIGNPVQIKSITDAILRGEKVFVRDAEDDLSFYHNLSLEELHRASQEAYARHFSDGGTLSGALEN